MASRSEPVVRDAEHVDAAAICRFGEAHTRPLYAPLIGAEAADEQVRLWWNETQIDAAVAEALVVVAETDGHLVDVGQRGSRGADHVVFKLYVHPRYRGHGLGLRLLDALSRQLRADADRLCIEHFVANVRAGAFYERAGFIVETTEPSPTSNPALDVVWRARPGARIRQAGWGLLSLINYSTGSFASVRSIERATPNSMVLCRGGRAQPAATALY